MSGAAKNYKIDKVPGIKDQITAIGAIAKKAGKLKQFIELMEEAVRRLETNPHGWGDPEYHSKHVDALYCHGMLPPLAFRYVIFEDTRGVLLLSVRLMADF
jgi:hypothetical protein